MYWWQLFIAFSLFIFTFCYSFLSSRSLEFFFRDEDDGLNTKNSQTTISLHVIHYERVNHHDIVSSVYPEICLKL